MKKTIKANKKGRLSMRRPLYIFYFAGRRATASGRQLACKAGVLAIACPDLIQVKPANGGNFFFLQVQVLDVYCFCRHGQGDLIVLEDDTMNFRVAVVKGTNKNEVAGLRGYNLRIL